MMSHLFFLPKKGDLTSIEEIQGFSSTDAIELKKVITTNGDFGEINSRSLLKDNSKLNLAYRINEKGAADEVVLEFNGRSSNGIEKTLLSSNKFVLDTTISSIDSIDSYSDYYFKLRVEDQLNQTPPQIDYWQITSIEVPDFAWAPNVFFSINNDSLKQGEMLNFSIAIANPSLVNSDSVKLRYEVFSNSNRKYLKEENLAPI